MRPIAIVCSYDGASFSGFARQPGLATVQGRIESALSTVCGGEVLTVGAGRTDAGVHARGQVMSCEIPASCADVPRLRRSLNALSGPGIVVREVRETRPGFSARFDAQARTYRYRIAVGPVPPLFTARFAWHVPHELEAEAMRVAARHLVGEHDFRSFCVAESAKDKSTVRRVDSIDIVVESHLGEDCLSIQVVGNAFLHSMVRVITGSLVEVGSGRRDPAWMARALAARAREAAGPTAPPNGLTLWHVAYPPNVWC